jgi:hypothetical protein
VPRLRSLTVRSASLTPAAACMIAATGWQLEELGLYYSPILGAAGLAPILAAPPFALGQATSNCQAAAWARPTSSPWPTHPGRSRSCFSRATT